MPDHTEPLHEVAHLGHIELLTPRPEESLHFFHEVLGMEEVGRQGESVYLRAWGDYERSTLKLTASGLGRGWTTGDLGHGPAYQFTDPDGHLMEIYYEAERYQAPPELRPALKNQPQRYTGRGAAVRRLDHINLLADEVTPNRRFMESLLGFRLREQVILDDGVEAGAWLSVTPLTHDIAYTLDATRTRGRLHHLAYWLDNREDILRGADLFLEHGIAIESGPSKHALTHAFFLYAFEPGGNRIELFSGGYLIFAPDWEPVVWNQAERARGQAWGLRLPPSFHTYGTPVVEVPAASLRHVPVVGPS